MQAYVGRQCLRHACAWTQTPHMRRVERTTRHNHRLTSRLVSPHRYVSSKESVAEPPPKGSTPATCTPTAPAVAPPKLTMKQVMKRYGGAALLVHSSVYVTALGTVYTALTFFPELASDATIWVHDHLGIDIPNEAGTLAAAWALTAVTGPPRGALTVVLAPIAARQPWFRSLVR
eukprot:m.100326 g.100326  ORF g.100326 m.100326 type:complete len:175 (-) comp10343_c0_seq2:2261-2785(-)